MCIRDSSSKARDAKVVRALLDIDKIKLDGDTLTGLEDQIEALKNTLKAAVLKGIAIETKTA